MSKLVVVEHVTLDGVMQGPGRNDEDVRNGFVHGGWGHRNAVQSRILAQGMAEGGPLLFGRRTYLDFYKVWPGRTDNPFSAILDNAQKYLASTTLREPLPWKNSTLLPADAMDAVARLKQQPGKDIVVLGSATLVESLARCHLVDEYVLMIHPLTLGTGRRLFPDGAAPAEFGLAEAEPTPTGVLVVKYLPATRPQGAPA